MVVGVLVASVAALADTLGVGEVGFGPLQGIGVLLGLGVAVTGLVLALTRSRSAGASDTAYREPGGAP